MEANIFPVGHPRKDRNGLEGKRVYILRVYMDDGGGEGGGDDTLSQIIWYGVGLNYANIG